MMEKELQDRLRGLQLKLNTQGDKGQVPLSPRLWLLQSLNQSSANSC